MRIFCFLSLLLLSMNGFAVDRDEMIQFFIEYEEVERRADEMIDKMKDDLIASSKKITNQNFNENFGELFENYREAYIQANVKANEVYSDERIKELYDFYNSDFGNWYRQEQEAFGPRVREIMEDDTKVLRSGITTKVKGLKKRKK